MKKVEYLKRKYPFYYYRGFIAGYVYAFLAFPLYRLLGIKIMPNRHYTNWGHKDG